VTSPSRDLSALRRSERDGVTDDPQSAVARGVPAPPRRWKTRVLLPVLLLLAFAAVLVPSAWRTLTPRLDVRVVPVVAKRGVTASGSVAFQATGWFEPDPYPVIATTLADGVIAEVLVLEGERVQRGQVLARLVPDDAQLALRRAEAVVQQHAAHTLASEVRMAAAQTAWDHPIARDEALASAECRALSARAEVERQARTVVMNEARLRELEEQLRRDEQQLPERAVSEFDVVRLRLRVDAERAALAAVRAGADVAKGALAQAEASLVAARENRRLRIEETETLAAARADLDRARAEHADVAARRDEAALRLSRMEVKAPIDGVVMLLEMAPGAKRMLGMDDPHSAHVAELYDPEKLQVRVDVPLADAAGLGVGQQAQIVAEVLPDRTFEGEVTRIVHEADIQKNTLQVKVAVRDPVIELKPEMLARVRFFGMQSQAQGGGESTRLFVPSRLLQARNGAQAQVWIVDKGRAVALRRDVTVGGESGDAIEITSGLSPGDALIDAPPAGLADGDAVRVTGEAR
jgi:RND family efflux transporter MFP subunit